MGSTFPHWVLKITLYRITSLFNLQFSKNKTLNITNIIWYLYIRYNLKLAIPCLNQKLVYHLWLHSPQQRLPISSPVSGCNGESNYPNLLLSYFCLLFVSVPLWWLLYKMLIFTVCNVRYEIFESSSSLIWHFRVTVLLTSFLWLWFSWTVSSFLIETSRFS